MEALTPRESEVLRLIADGKSTKQLAAELGIAFKTAACHRYRLLSKTGASNTAALVSMALREGLLDSPVGESSPGNGESYSLETDRIAMLLEESKQERLRLRDALAELHALVNQLRVSRQEVRAAREQAWRNRAGGGRCLKQTGETMFEPLLATSA